MMYKIFEDKTALVIGGVEGLGKEVARLLLSHGAEVIVTGCNQVSVDATITELEGLGAISGRQVDLTHDFEVDQFVEDLKAIVTGEIDFLVNAPRGFAPKKFEETTLPDYDACLDTNRALYFITQAVTGKMKVTGGGAIVNICSYWAGSAMKGVPVSAFAMAKSGLEALTRQLAIELADENIRVNAIIPGVKESSVVDELAAGSPEKAAKLVAEMDVLIPPSPGERFREIVPTILFLLSDEAKPVSGAVWQVDGGPAIRKY
jgi:NAD(P)-dependent dehydrogenase (short-subunit alcohol dehydrogenase family)